MQENRYFNEGWFGRHPSVYDVAGTLVLPIRIRAAKALAERPLMVIDVATGTGTFAYELARLGHTVVGIDIDEEMLARTRGKRSRKLRLCFAHGDGMRLPFASNRFDAATCFSAIHDVPFEVGVTLLQEMKRVVAETGLIYIVDYADPASNAAAGILSAFAKIYESPNYTSFAERGLRDYAEAAGLRAMAIRHFMGMQFVRLMAT